MDIVTSKAYRKWRKSTKNANAVDVIENFLCRVLFASSIKEVSPKPKAAGGNLRKTPGSVDEFVLGRQERVYAKVIELEPGIPTFCVASAGIKGNTKQNGDIYNALKVFDDIEKAEFIAWDASPDRMLNFICDELITRRNELQDDGPADDDVPEDVPAQEGGDIPEEAPAQKKGKPLDENGLTVAERKSQHKKKQEEARQKAAEQKKRESSAKKEEQSVVQQDISKDAETDNVTETPTVAVTDGAPAVAVPDENTDAVVPNVDASEKPIVTLNGVTVSEPMSLTGDEKYQDVMDAQYELEMIEHQIKIEQLEIEVIRQNIAITKREIELEKLAMERLKLLQAKRKQEPQK